MNHQSLSSFIWSVADLLRGDYKQSDYGKVILPFTVLRRLDCVLEATKPKVLVEYAAKKKEKLNPDPFLLRASRQSFYNISPMEMGKLMGDQDHIRDRPVNISRLAKSSASWSIFCLSRMTTCCLSPALSGPSMTRQRALVECSQ